LDDGDEFWSGWLCENDVFMCVGERSVEMKMGVVYGYNWMILGVDELYSFFRRKKLDEMKHQVFVSF